MRGFGVLHGEARAEAATPTSHATARTPLPFLHEDARSLVGYLPANDRSGQQADSQQEDVSSEARAPGAGDASPRKRKRGKRLAQHGRNPTRSPTPPPPPRPLEGTAAITAARETRRSRQHERALLRRATKWPLPEEPSSEHARAVKPQAGGGATSRAGEGECRVCGSMSSKGKGGGAKAAKDLNCCHRGGSWYGLCGKGKGLRHTFRDGWRACNANGTARQTAAS